MASNSLLFFNSSSTLNHLRSNRSSPINRKLILPSPITFSSPLTHCRSRRSRRPLIISEMESSKTDTTLQFHDKDAKSLSSGDLNSLAPTSNIASGKKLQLISISNIPTWAKLVLGSIVLLAIPFSRKVLRIKDFTKTVEEVAEVVEKVAEVTEQVAEGIAEVLPDGSSIKNAAVRLEKIAFLVDKQAEITESFITKVDDAVEVLDTTLKPLLDGEVKMNEDEEKMMTPTIVATATTKLKISSDKLDISNEL